MCNKNHIKFLYAIDVQPFLDRIARKYASPMRIWFGPKMLVFIADAESAEIILKSKDCLDKPDIFYNVIRDTLGSESMLTVDGKRFL